MEQSKKNSLFEMLLNQSTGFVIAYAVWGFVINPLLKNGSLSIDNTFSITIIFTAISIIRGFCFRRIFNYYHHKDEK